MRSLCFLTDIGRVLPWCSFDSLLVALHLSKMTAVRPLCSDVPFVKLQPTQWSFLELVVLNRMFLPGYTWTWAGDYFTARAAEKDL